MALLGIGFLFAPLPILIRLFGSIGLFLVLPAVILREYWPKLSLADLGWQHPVHPRRPHLYSLAAIVIAFLPLGIFLIAPDPSHFVAVTPSIGWIAWLLGEAVVAMLIVSQSAFFTGLLLFRLTHLVRPWVAVVLVGLILAMTQLFIPGIVRYIALPLTMTLAWMAWQTKSFVPVAVLQIGITVFYDLIVRLT